jgi:hypothetical protein
MGCGRFDTIAYFPQNAIEITQNFVIFHAQHSHTQRPDQLITALVSVSCTIMNRPVDLQHQRSLMAIEIGDIITALTAEFDEQGMLACEFNAAKPPVPQCLPEERLGFRLAFPQFPASLPDS